MIRLLARPTVVLIVVLVGSAVSGCGPAGASAPAGSDGGVGGDGGDRIRVVASTTVFADIVASVGGDHVTVDSIVPAGAGPEDYEPRPDDARRLAEADLIVSNGVGLDDFLDKLIEAAGAGQAEHLVLGDRIPTITVDGEQNPHFWLDPSLVATYYVPAIRDALIRLDPDAQHDVLASADGYVATLRQLDDASHAKLDTIPPDQRKLVTFHDAFPYFAKHYGFDLVGVILQNPGQEPSAADLAALVRTVRAARVHAVFTEAQFDPKLARTLADEAGITSVVSTLYTDSLGPAPADSYAGLLTWDVDEIVKALS
jgi:zinc/manganese transport system substrate-binding protein/manganese/iron transport system substrate-binding protein